MNDFVSLSGALEGWFDKPLFDLPKVLRQRVEQALFPLSWDDLSVNQRIEWAPQWDYQHDPATEGDRKFRWDCYVRMDEIKKEIEKWGAVSAPTAIDLEKKEARLAELNRELSTMAYQERQVFRHKSDNQRLRPEAMATTKPEYIPYPKALKILSDRLNAIPEEIAAWVWVGLDEGGLAAYVNANELNPPPRFYFTCHQAGDYISPLMACWFHTGDIAAFQPRDRFITGQALMAHWSDRPGIKVEAYIKARMAESRLMDFQPLTGETQWIDYKTCPHFESALFLRDQVEKIEAEDFGDGLTECVTKPLGHLNHDTEMQARANQIASERKGAIGRPITRDEVAKILAKELGMDHSTVLRRIRKQWK